MKKQPKGKGVSENGYLKVLWILFGIACGVYIILILVGISSCDMIIYLFLLFVYLIFCTLMTIGYMEKRR